MGRTNPRAAPAPASPAAVGWSVAVAVGAVAFVVRWHVGGGLAGLHGLHGYDDGVYFAGAMAFVHGAMPYRDFTLLHPPAVLLALAPFAALTRWVPDASAFVVARVAFMVVGAANAVLVTRVARRWGTAPAVVAGLLYAVSRPAAFAERSTLLEPLGTLTFLTGAVLLERGGRWRQVVAAVLLSLCLLVKIWDVVPVVVLLAWWAHRHGRRAGLRLAGLTAAVAALVLLPFLVAAAGPMLRMVVLDQLGRPRTGDSVAVRLEGVTGVDATVVTASPAGRLALLGGVCALLAVLAVLAWRARRGRLWAVVLAAEVTVVLVSPSWFEHYGGYPAAAQVLVAAAGLSVLPRPARAWLSAGVAGALTATGGALAGTSAAAFPAARVQALVPATGCVASDEPTALALTDVLSRDLARHCPLPVDFTGMTYDVDRLWRDGVHVGRTSNPLWQHSALTYLTDASATLLARPTGDGLSAATHRRIAARHLALHLPGITLYVAGRPTIRR